jgi:hypothetical protein
MMAIDSGGSTSVQDRVFGLETSTKRSRAEANGGILVHSRMAKRRFRYAAKILTVGAGNEHHDAVA